MHLWATAQPDRLAFNQCTCLPDANDLSVCLNKSTTSVAWHSPNASHLSGPPRQPGPIQVPSVPFHSNSVLSARIGDGHNVLRLKVAAPPMVMQMLDKLKARRLDSAPPKNEPRRIARLLPSASRSASSEASMGGGARSVAQWED